MPDTRPTIMTVSELADYLRLHEQTIYKMAKEGHLPASRVGNRWRFEKDQINRWLRQRQHAAADESLSLGGANEK